MTAVAGTLKRWRDRWTDPHGIIAETVSRAEGRLEAFAVERQTRQQELRAIQHVLDGLQREQEADFAELAARHRAGS